MSPMPFLSALAFFISYFTPDTVKTLLKKIYYLFSPYPTEFSSNPFWAPVDHVDCASIVEIELSNRKVYKYWVAGFDELIGRVTGHSQFEPKSRKLFQAHSKTGYWSLDVGAYTGLFALEALASNEGVRVAVFEPNPSCMAVIGKNLALNGLEDRVQKFQLALASYDGLADFYVPVAEKGFSVGSMLSPRFNFKIFQIPVSPLDKLIGEFENCSVIKIDAEGSEVELLNGARRFISIYRPALIIEILNRKQFRILKRILESEGYDKGKRVGYLNGDEKNFIFLPAKFK